MSPDEKREQKVRLRIELEEAEEELNHCREAANATSDLLAQLAEWLRVSPVENIYLAGRSIHHGFEVRPLPQKYVQAFDFKGLISVADDIRKAQRRVLDLQTRLAKL
jgi:AAA+ ATPase superfamily predicted ATPase